MDESHQTERAKAVLKNCCLMLGIQEAQLIGVKDNDRFILSYEQDPTKPDFAKNMIKLETLMRKTMGVVIDLRLEAKEDRAKRNKSRERMADHSDTTAKQKS